MSGTGTDLTGVPLPYLGNPSLRLLGGVHRVQLSRESARTAERETEAQQRLRAIFDQTLHFMGLLDVNGVVLEANRPVLEAVGLSPEECSASRCGRRRCGPIPKNCAKRVRRATITAARGRSDQLRKRGIRCPTARSGTSSSRHAGASDEHGARPARPRGRDVTARKKTQAGAGPAGRRHHAANRTGILQSWSNTLCEICEVDYVMAASIDPGAPARCGPSPSRSAGRPAENFSYTHPALRARRRSDGGCATTRLEVQALFPEDRGLASSASSRTWACRSVLGRRQGAG